MKVEIGTDNKIRVIKSQPEQILVVAQSGYGKSLFCSRIAEAYHKKGYIVISIVDIKDVWEHCFACFEPREKYHLDELRKSGIKPSKKKIKIFSPFTFNIPKTSLPPVTFFTIPIKDLRREEISMLFETNYDTNIMKLVLNNIQLLKNNDSIQKFLFDIERSIESNREGSAKRDWKLFGLKNPMAGNIKDVKEISSTFIPFLDNFFLTDKNCELNLDVKRDIFGNPDEYKILVTPYVNDIKLKYFAMVCFFFKIIRQIKKSPRPVVFIWEEVKELTPFRSQGFERFMADVLKKYLSTMRTLECSSIMSSQTYFDIDEKVRNSATKLFLGGLGGLADSERVGKALRYNSETIRMLSSNEKNDFLFKGHEEMGMAKGLFPSHCHKEVKYNFIKMFAQEYPKQMKKYKDITDYMKDRVDSQFGEFKEKILEKEKRRREAKKKEQEKKEREKLEEESAKEKVGKKTQEQLLEEVKKRCYETYKRLVQEEGKISWRKLGKEVGLSYHTAKKYVQEQLDIEK